MRGTSAVFLKILRLFKEVCTKFAAIFHHEPCGHSLPALTVPEVVTGGSWRRNMWQQMMVRIGVIMSVLWTIMIYYDLSRSCCWFQRCHLVDACRGVYVVLFLFFWTLYIKGSNYHNRLRDQRQGPSWSFQIIMKWFCQKTNSFFAWSCPRFVAFKPYLGKLRSELIKMI